MVDHIVNNDILTNNSIKQQQELLGIERKSASKNPYQKVNEFTDQLDISKEALKLYEKEKEMEKYRQMVLESIEKDMSISEIIQLVNSPEYLNNDELAESLLKNDDFLGLFE